MAMWDGCHYTHNLRFGRRALRGIGEDLPPHARMRIQALNGVINCQPQGVSCAMSTAASNEYQPRPEDHFTFGLWTVGNIGRDPFGEPVREKRSPADLVRLLGDVGGVYGVNFHDNDLIPVDATAAESDEILRDFKMALAETG